MKVAWAHDARLIPRGKQVYTDWQLPASQWERYLSHFRRMVVLCRRGEMPAHLIGTADLERTSREEIDFVFLPNLSGIHGQLVARRRAAERMTAVIAGADGVIARLPSEIGLIAADIGHRLGKAVALEVVTCGWDSLWNHGSLQAKFYAPIMRARMRRAASQADHVLYVTDSFLQRRYPTRAANIAACSNVELPSIDNAALAHRLARPVGTRFTFGLIGTLQTRAKGIQTVLQALATHPGRLGEVRFRVLGNGDPDAWRQEAEALGVAHQVAFEGVVRSGAPVMRWLDELDCYLQPSLQDGLPRSLIEAMSRGCPAIGTRRGGIPELLDDDCLSRPGDARSLAALMLRIIDDTQWRMTLATRNQQRSRPYLAANLAQKRDAFWRRFAETID